MRRAVVAQMKKWQKLVENALKILIDNSPPVTSTGRPAASSRNTARLMAADADGAAPSRQPEPRHRWLWHLENGFSGLILVLVAVVPTVEILARWIFKTGILGVSDLTHHLVLWLTCLGGAITSREGKHITLSAGVDQIREPVRGWILTITSFISASIAAAMTWSSLALLMIGFDPSKNIGFVPIRLAAAVLPVGFALMTARFVIHTPSVQPAGSRLPGRAAKRAVASLGLAAGTLIAFSSVMDILSSFLPRLPEALYRLADSLATLGGRGSSAAIIVLIVSVLLGTPVFIGLGGVAFLLFLGSGGALEVVANELMAY
jgi:C4-dicarboxylate transporter DctM subunit